jgi:hypothetical protein
MPDGIGDDADRAGDPGLQADCGKTRLSVQDRPSLLEPPSVQRGGVAVVSLSSGDDILAIEDPVEARPGRGRGAEQPSSNNPNDQSV